MKDLFNVFIGLFIACFIVLTISIFVDIGLGVLAVTAGLAILSLAGMLVMSLGELRESQVEPEWRKFKS